MSNVNTSTRSRAKGEWAVGGTIFGATMMVVIGTFQILMGISAIADDNVFVTRNNGYTYNVDLTGWGWIHLILGGLIVITGFGIFTGYTWAKVAGIVLTVLSAVDNFLFLPYYPIWSLVLVALDVFVIWALSYSLRMERDVENALMAQGAAGYAEAQAGQRWATNPSAGYRPADPEAAGRASDMATPSGARHAAEPTTAAEQEHAGMPRGGTQGGGTQGGGMQGGEQQQRPPGT
jgi:hypothetical protein